MSRTLVERDNVTDSLSEEASLLEEPETLPDDAALEGAYEGFQPAWVVNCLATLREFALLKTDWDHQGSLSPTPQALDAAQRVLLALAESDVPRPHMTPADDGAITFEWTGGDLSLTIDVYSSAQAVMHFMFMSTLEEWEGHPSDSPTNLDKLFRHLSEGNQ